MIVPCILLRVQIKGGLSWQPIHPEIGFRIMGASLYIYSLYNMYNNALDACRAKLLNWAIQQSVPSIFWLPMLVGEFANVMVSLILVLTLFVIFVDTVHPADL